ncbi:unnamed protein product [Cuscuta campestris]|uniref:Reverse transcriptase zinc-binding domain-containing protein n=1 Tax=Cuscuta campestris TaxID=132261 RepID=A0A484NB97_9ASTE|nr:unnamed protein product [Cuscuta campestris]
MKCSFFCNSAWLMAMARAGSWRFQFDLVGSFFGKRPPLEIIRKWLEKIGFVGFSVGLLHPSHVLINLWSEKDYQRLFLRKDWNVQGATMNITKWTTDFDPREEDQEAFFRNRKITFKEAYLAIQPEEEEEDAEPLQHMQINWNMKQIPKISFFLWRLHHKLLPFPAQLRKFGITSLPSICYLCKRDSDTATTLSFNAPMLNPFGATLNGFSKYRGKEHTVDGCRLKSCRPLQTKNCSSNLSPFSDSYVGVEDDSVFFVSLVKNLNCWCLELCVVKERGVAIPFLQPFKTSFLFLVQKFIVGSLSVECSDFMKVASIGSSRFFIKSVLSFLKSHFQVSGFVEDISKAGFVPVLNVLGETL